MEAKERNFIERCGKRSLRALWAYATAEDTPMQQRAKLQQYFVELAFGKPTTMTGSAAADEGGGVVILPAVELDELDG